MSPIRNRPARILFIGAIALSLGACMQLVGADFGDVAPADESPIVLDGSIQVLPDGAVVTVLPDGNVVPVDSSLPNGGHDAGPTGDHDGGHPIDDDGGTIFVDASCGALSTTITGKVYDPSGKTPLYDVMVFIPSAPLDPFPTTRTCDLCGAMPSGAPIAIDVSKSDGSFTLVNVPAGVDIPIVVQTGKWRRLAHIPQVTPCTTNALTDPNLTRLPKNGTTDGDMPRIAIAAGAGDAIECVLYGMGVDVAEFSSPGGTGHVTVFAESGGGYVTSSLGPDGGSQGPMLYGDANVLDQYDEVFFGCEGQANVKTPAFAQNVASYASRGGRVWIEHYEMTWLTAMPAPYTTAISFYPDATYTPATTIDIATTSPKAASLASWMQANGKTSAAQSTSFAAADTRGDVAGTTVGRVWMSASAQSIDDAGVATNVSIPQTVVMNTPPGAGALQACGRVMYADFHSGEAFGLTTQFPSECSGGVMGPEAYAMEYEILDLGSCILSDDVAPSPP